MQFNCSAVHGVVDINSGADEPRHPLTVEQLLSGAGRHPTDHCWSGAPIDMERIEIDLVIGRNVACVYAPRQRKHRTICDKVVVPSGLKAVCDCQLPKCLHVCACMVEWNMQARIYAQTSNLQQQQTRAQSPTFLGNTRAHTCW